MHDVPQLFAKAISSRSERDQRLLAASAVCVSDWFWLPLAASIADLGEDDADDAADALVNTSLMRVVNRDRRRFQAHAILREQILAGRSQSEIDALQRRHAEALDALAGEWKAHSALQYQQEIDLASTFLEAHGDAEQSLAMQRKAQPMWQELNNLAYVSLNYEGQALLLRKLGRIDEAITMLEQQEAICLKLGDRDGLRRGYLDRAAILNSADRYQEALALLDGQHAIVEDVDDREALLLALTIRAFTLMRLPGRGEDAIRILEKVEKLATDVGDKSSLAFCYWNWATIAEDLGQRSVAQDKLSRAVKLFTDLKMVEARDAVQGFLNSLAG